MYRYWLFYILIVCSVGFVSVWTSSAFAIGVFLFLIAVPIYSYFLFEKSCANVTFDMKEEFDENLQEVHLSLVCVKNTRIPISNIDVLLTFENLLFQSQFQKIYSFFPKNGENVFPLNDFIPNCGQQRVTMNDAFCYDFFHLFKKKVEFDMKWSYIMYPYHTNVQVSLSQNIRREKPGEIYDPKRKGNDISEVFNLREYQEGDSLKSIHWKLSAKTDSIIVREFSRPINYQVLILLDPAFYYEQEKVRDEVNNAIYSLSLAISEQLVEKQFSHYVGWFYNDQFTAYAIDNPDSLERLKDSMMVSPFHKSCSDTFLQFLVQQLYDQFTKVIYITPGISDSVAVNVSKFVDLSIIIPGKETVEVSKSMDYAMVSISLENIRNTLFKISL